MFSFAVYLLNQVCVWVFDKGPEYVPAPDLDEDEIRSMVGVNFMYDIRNLGRGQYSYCVLGHLDVDCYIIQAYLVRGIPKHQLIDVFSIPSSR